MAADDSETLVKAGRGEFRRGPIGTAAAAFGIIGGLFAAGVLAKSFIDDYRHQRSLGLRISLYSMYSSESSDVDWDPSIGVRFDATSDEPFYDIRELTLVLEMGKNNLTGRPEPVRLRNPEFVDQNADYEFFRRSPWKGIGLTFGKLGTKRLAIAAVFRVAPYTPTPFTDWMREYVRRRFFGQPIDPNSEKTLISSMYVEVIDEHGHTFRSGEFYDGSKTDVYALNPESRQKMFPGNTSMAVVVGKGALRDFVNNDLTYPEKVVTSPVDKQP